MCSVPLSLAQPVLAFPGVPWAVYCSDMCNAACDAGDVMTPVQRLEMDDIQSFKALVVTGAGWGVAGAGGERRITRGGCMG